MINSNYLNIANNSLTEVESFDELNTSIYGISPEDLQTKDFEKILLSLENYDSVYSTQQLESIDYSKFKNHVFFDSAVNKVSYVFSKILKFPYDKSEIEVRNYINNLEGYTKYILKNVFPKNTGSIKFTGNEKVKIKNSTGSFLENKPDAIIGELFPKERFSFNFWLKIVSAGFTPNQTIFKFYNENFNSGFVCFASSSGSDFFINFLSLNSGFFIFEKTKVLKDEFQNININVSTLEGERKVSFFINGNKTKSEVVVQGNLLDDEYHESLKQVDTKFVLGSAEGVIINIGGTNYSFTNFTGYLDEFRYFKDISTFDDVKKNLYKNIFAQSKLVCYLKFNEPGGDYNNSCVCLDSSGKKLHGILFDNSESLILDTTANKSIENPLKLENLEYSAVMNSRFPDIESKHSSLIQEASTYDRKNPNLIFKLMPKHYFLEASDSQNLPVFSNSDFLKSEDNEFDNYIPATNHFTSIVLIWAKFFDQLKIHIDSISDMVDVDYESINNKTILGIKIPMICKMYGLNFSEIFSSMTKRKLDKEALSYEDIVNEISIRKIQNEIWYKILINTQSIISSKGTINSIEQVLNSIGADGIENIDIREHTSFNDISNFSNLFYKEKSKKLTSSFLNNKLILKTTQFENISSFSLNKPYIEISNIKSSNQISSINKYTVQQQDLLSGLGNDFSLEYYFEFNKKESDLFSYNNIQNLFRVDLQNNPVVNAYFERSTSENNIFSLIVDIKPVTASYRFNKRLRIDNIDLFSKENFICLSQKVVGSNIEYVLTYGKANSDHISDRIISESVYFEVPEIVLRNLFSIQQNINIRTGEYYYDNDTTQLFALENTKFEGSISCIKIWSKKLDTEEVKNHLKNYKNCSERDLSVTNLVSNFYFKQSSSLSSNVAGNIKSIKIPDSSFGRYNENYINECNLSIRDVSFDLDSLIEYHEAFTYNKNFNLDSTLKQNKVNILSYSESQNRIKTDNHLVGPVHNTNKDFDHERNNGFSLDFSIVKNINNDISRLIVGLDDFKEVLSNNSMYFYNYKDLETLKNKYFSRYDEDVKINYTSLINVYRYLDNIMSDLLNSMVPDKTKFSSFNFVYESHILERNKYQHKNSDSRVSIYDRNQSFSFSRPQERTFRSDLYDRNRAMRK